MVKSGDGGGRGGIKNRIKSNNKSTTNPQLACWWITAIVAGHNVDLRESLMTCVQWMTNIISNIISGGLPKTRYHKIYRVIYRISMVSLKPKYGSLHTMYGNS